MGKNDGRSVTISGVAGSNIVLGDGNSVIHNTKGSEGPADQDVRLALEQMSKLLQELVDQRDAPRVKRALTDAIDEIQTKEPRKDVISAAIKRAVEIAGGAKAIADIATQLQPLLERVQVWLGAGFGSLLRQLG